MTPRNWEMPSDEEYEALQGLDRNRCPVCGGLGVLLVDTRYMPCPEPDCEAGQVRRGLLEQRMKHISNLPKMYVDASLSDFSRLSPDARKGKETAFTLARAFADHLSIDPSILGDKWQWNDAPRNWLVLAGAIGTGKTYLVCSIINHINRHHGKPALYIRLHDLIQNVLSSYDDDASEDSQRILWRYEDMPVLMIDEFNLEKVTEHTRQTMEAILRYRYAQDKPTLFTLNQNQQQFQDAWGERIATVMFDKAVWCNMRGRSLRNHAGEVG